MKLTLKPTHIRYASMTILQKNAQASGPTATTGKQQQPTIGMAASQNFFAVRNKEQTIRKQFLNRKLGQAFEPTPKMKKNATMDVTSQMPAKSCAGPRERTMTRVFTPQATGILGQSLGHTRSQSLVDSNFLQAQGEIIVPESKKAKKQLRFSSQEPEVREVDVDEKSRKARMSYKQMQNLADLEAFNRIWNQPTELGPLQRVKSTLSSTRDVDSSHDIRNAMKHHAHVELDQLDKMESLNVSPMQIPPLQQLHIQVSAIEKYNQLTPEEQIKELLSPSKLSKDRDREISALINKKLDFKSGSKTSHKTITHQALRGKNSAQLGMQGIDLKQLRGSGTQNNPHIQMTAALRK